MTLNKQLLQEGLIKNTMIAYRREGFLLSGSISKCFFAIMEKFLFPATEKLLTAQIKIGYPSFVIVFSIRKFIHTLYIDDDSPRLERFQFYPSSFRHIPILTEEPVFQNSLFGCS